jgi:hypothetical protein
MKNRNVATSTPELMTPTRAMKLDAIVEQAIDEFGLQRVVDSLARICSEKGGHVSDNWQDYPLAGWWFRRSALIQKCADKIGMENT